jgi:hypothetical protein
MTFHFSITTPANTTEANKIKTTFRVAKGILHHYDILFPPGPYGLCHIHINDALHQLLPYNTDESFSSDGETISFKEFLPILEPPYELSAYTWNLDDTFPHTVYIRIGILPIEIFAPWLLPLESRIQSVMES